MKVIKLEVTVEVPEGVSISELLGYVKEAVQVWSKSGDPDSPIWDLKCKKVRRIKEEPKE